MDTIDRKVLYSMHFGEYTVNTHGLLQYNVDEDIFVWRSEGRRAVTKSFNNTEELLACVQGQQDDGDRWSYRWTGELMLQTVYQYRMHINGML